MLVAIGILLEIERPLNVKKILSFAAVIIGVFLGAAGTLLLLKFDEAISLVQQRTISAQQSTIASLEKDTAEATRIAGTAIKRASELDIKSASLNKEAEELKAKNLELEMRLAPRHLEKAAKLIARIGPFSGTKFAMSSGSTAETENFGIEIADALTSAGWQWVPWPLGGVATNPPRGKPQMGLDLMAGIEVHVFNDANKPAAIELFHGLSDAGFKSVWIPMPPPTPAVADTMVIIVGSKE